MTTHLGLDIGSNSVGSCWICTDTGQITAGTSIFPAGVDETDDKRGEPKNAKRRMARRARITLRRRAQRKRELRQKLVAVGLLPKRTSEIKHLLEETDPWELRWRGLEVPLHPFEFGRVLLHLAQRRGALGLSIADVDGDAENEDGKVKQAISEVRVKMLQRNARTFGEFMAMVRAERITAIETVDRRSEANRKGPREYREAIRNKAASYEHCADRDMIRHEFSELWRIQRDFGGNISSLLTDELRRILDNDVGDSTWRHQGLLFEQRRQSWDLGTLGRCVLEPTERCVPHCDRYASRFLVVETVNNLRIIERGQSARPLTSAERHRLCDYLSSPLGIHQTGKKKGQPKRSVSVTDLRELMGWGRATKTTPFRFNIETDEDRIINTDWFSREIVHGAITVRVWSTMPERVREGINRAILKYDPEQDGAAEKLKVGVMSWGSLTDKQADALVAAWKCRPKPDVKRLNMSRKAVRNVLAVMDREEPWPDSQTAGAVRWLTQIEARKLIAATDGFADVTTSQPLDEVTRRRYAIGAKGATARDRHYLRKHVLRKDGKPIIGPDGNPLAEPPPAPLISNPVVRKAIHEVRRHLIEYMTTFGRRPDYVHIELAREARMGKKDADRLLFKNRLRNRIRNDILEEFNKHSVSATQQRAAVERVLLAIQQGGICPLCGNQVVREVITPRMAADGIGCEVAHIVPRGSGGQNGFGNTVLAHRKCNQDMGRRTPRQFWETSAGGKEAFDEAIARVERMYGDIARPKYGEIKAATGPALWSCYFSKYDDTEKIAQFKKEVTDIQGMTAMQEAATKQATRQVMAYLADALYGGEGLPERGGQRRIFATDGHWTARFRREWSLFFDPHQRRASGLTNDEEQLRNEKDRGDHRHHAIDAIVTAVCDSSVKWKWDERERQAERDGINTADEEQLAHYRKCHPLPAPDPFESAEQFREAVRLAVFGGGEVERPICHRPVKRKLIGALHEETLYGPVLDRAGKLTQFFTAKKSVLDLDPNHLRMPRAESASESVKRLTLRRQRAGVDRKSATKWARAAVAAKGFMPAMVDPPTGLSGLVRDLALRARLRECLIAGGLDPNDFTAKQIKTLADSGGICQASGVPIRRVVLLRTMTNPVILSRWATHHGSGERYKIYDAIDGSGDPRAARAYLGGNNHHIEIRVATDKKGNAVWSGQIVTAHQAAQRNLAKLRALRTAGIPRPKDFAKLTKAERMDFRPRLREIELAHALVDRIDDDTKGGKFVMSLCEGETLLMKHKHTGAVGYFVVAKLSASGTVVVPHWDARPAGERKDVEGSKVPHSRRDQFQISASDVLRLAPPGQLRVRKVRVSPLGRIRLLEND